MEISDLYSTSLVTEVQLFGVEAGNGTTLTRPPDWSKIKTNPVSNDKVDYEMIQSQIMTTLCSYAVTDLQSTTPVVSFDQGVLLDPIKLLVLTNS